MKKGKPVIKKNGPKEIYLPRGRLIQCSGCPTVTCTCFTDMERDLLQKTSELLKALGFYAMSQFAEQSEPGEDE